MPCACLQPILACLDVKLWLYNLLAYLLLLQERVVAGGCVPFDKVTNREQRAKVLQRWYCFLHCMGCSLAQPFNCAGFRLFLNARKAVTIFVCNNYNVHVRMLSLSTRFMVAGAVLFDCCFGRRFTARPPFYAPSPPPHTRSQHSPPDTGRTFRALSFTPACHPEESVPQPR